MRWRILGILLLAITIEGAELEVVGRGGSRYQVVLPDQVKNKAVDYYLQLTGKLVVKCLHQASGTTLPLVRESDMEPDRPSIFIGYTEALRKNGIKPELLKAWEHRIEVRNGNIYLYGRDEGNWGMNSSPDYHQLLLGSVKAVTVFLEQFAGTAFLYRGDTGISVLPQEQIRIPESYSYRKVPVIQFCTTLGGDREQGIFYEIANNLFPGPWYFTYGGHSHPSAVPKKFFAAHPEYFALVKGKRVNLSQPQYCLSNPEVQSRIYREMLRHLDKGYQMVQLAQSDGFVACECKPCRNLYGVKDYGEKLWILHRRLAERLLRERPGKQVCILAYGPTLKPPETFRAFPENVMIELAPCDEEVIALWKDYRVPGGFTAYLYNWGWYQLEGFMPKMSLEALAEQVESFHRHNIHGLYRCGFGELFGLEGPSYYIWGKLLENPAYDRDLLLKRYCRHAFGLAAPEMEEFYRLLNERLKFDLPPGSRRVEWYRPELLNNQTPALIETMRLMAMRYPAEVIGRMDELLTRAEKRNSGELLSLLRREFDYLKLTVKVTEVFDRLRQSKSGADFQEMLTTLNARNRFIAQLPRRSGVKPPQIAPLGVFSLFGCPPVDHLENGGRLLGRLRAPFNWDVDWLSANRIQPVNRVLKTGAAPQLLVQAGFDVMKDVIKQQPIWLECRWDSRNLSLIFRCRNLSPEQLAGEEFQTIIGYRGKRWWFAGRPRRGIASFFEREKTNLETGGDGDRYRQLPQTTASVTLSGSKNGETSVTLKLPWSALGLKPFSGMRLELNAACFGRGHYIWEYNLDQKSYRNFKDQTGTLILE